MPIGIYKRIKGVKYSAFGKTWKVKDTSNYKGQNTKGKTWKIKDTSRMNKDKIGKPSGMLGKRYKCSEAKKKKIGDSNRGKILPSWSNDKIRVKKASDRMKDNTWALGIHYKRSEETKKKMSKWHINNPNKKFSNTLIEQKIAKELEKRGFKRDQDFFQNYPLENIANVDFYLPKHNIVIECDGDYWHNLPKTKIKDQIKNEKIKMKNYLIYRFWEHEINDSPENCINRVKI